MGVYFGSYRGLVGIHAEGILLFIGNNRGLYVGKLLDLVGFFCGHWGLFLSSPLPLYCGGDFGSSEGF